MCNKEQVFSKIGKLYLNLEKAALEAFSMRMAIDVDNVKDGDKIFVSIRFPKETRLPKLTFVFDFETELYDNNTGYCARYEHNDVKHEIHQWLPQSLVMDTTAYVTLVSILSIFKRKIDSSPIEVDLDTDASYGFKPKEVPPSMRIMMSNGSFDGSLATLKTIPATMCGIREYLLIHGHQHNAPLLFTQCHTSFDSNTIMIGLDWGRVYVIVMDDKIIAYCNRLAKA